MAQSHSLRRFPFFGIGLPTLLALLFIQFFFFSQASLAQETYSPARNAPCPLIRGGSRCYSPQQVFTDGSSAPSWAGIVALSDQYAGKRLGFLNAGLYRIRQHPFFYAQGFHDITRGNNSMTISGNGQALVFPGYSAGSGWDAVSGLGTPKVAQLITLLVRDCSPDDGSNF